MKKQSLLLIPSMILGLLLTASTASAVEPKNPASTCERFAGEKDKTECKKQMKANSPDWYLAGICAKQFDDKSFYECVNLGKTAKFSPEKIQNCDNTTAADDTRLACLKEVAQVGASADIYQRDRKPADDRRWEKGYVRSIHTR